MKAQGTRLDPILASVRARLDARRRERPLAELRRDATPDPARRARFTAALKTDTLEVIAEIKRRSPAKGFLAVAADPLDQAQRYARGGAAALSILTEEDHFRGSPADLERVAPAGLPRLRKDFLLDESMVIEGLLWGADAVLLLACVLEGPRLGELRAVAKELGLAALVEVHDDDELERALAVEPDLIGINARDLTTFTIDLATIERLMPQVPARFVRVAESGIGTVGDLRRVRAAGADAALVGEALMRAADAEAKLRAWKEALREG